jgi:PRTRC genetic system protein A
MFNVYLHNGENPLPEDDICYIIAKDGIYLKKKLGVMDSIAPVKEISILQTIQPTAKMNIPKIPAVEFGKIYEFFKAVYQAHSSESIVLLFFNETTKKYKVIAPHQKVSGAGAEYDRGIVIEGHTMIGTIHSHANFSAFHSGTDVGDEMNFDGLHITIGHVNSHNPSITACIVANGHRVVVEPEEYVAGIIKESEAMKEAQAAQKPDTKKDETPTGKQVYRIVNGALVRDIPGYQNRTPGVVYHTPAYSSWGNDKRYLIRVPEAKRKFNPKWLDLVEKGTHQYNWRKYKSQGRFVSPYFVGDEWWDATGEVGEMEGFGWGSHYSPHWWKQRSLPPASSDQKPSSHYAKGPIIIENGEAPCANCKYRDFKLQEEDLEVWYKCTQCNITVKEDENAEITVCPRCKSPDHLEEIEDFGLVDKYIPVLHSGVGIKDAPVETPEPQSTFHKCKSCGTTFNRFDSQVECPFCYKKIEEEYSKEDEIHAQAQKDSGEFLDKEFEEVQKSAVQPIPDPTTGVTPIKEKLEPPQPQPQKVHPVTLRDMFKRVFGGNRR